MADKPSALNDLLREQLGVAQKLNQKASAKNTSGTIMEIPDTGTIVSTAYEQLRNAAEYSEEHLLLERAIKRFYKRNLFLTKRLNKDLGTELIIDLTQAGYLQDKQFSKTTAEKLSQLTLDYMSVYGRLRQAHIERDEAENWVLALISTETEARLNPHNIQQATLFFAYNYFLQALPRDRFAGAHDTDQYELCLYIAIHQAILKSDLDIIRHDLQRLYKQSPQDTQGFIRLNKQVDALYGSPLTQDLKRMVSRYGAPFRILRTLSDDQPDIAAILPDKKRFLELYSRHITSEYKQLDTRLTNGLTKSIIFIIITKLLIGVAIEIPYDLLLHGEIIWLPLAINLLFPPIYMASLKIGLSVPSDSNKRSVRNYMEQLLYTETKTEIQMPAQRSVPLGTKLIYSTLFAIPIFITVYILDRLGFNIVQMIIFFVFFSTASFLGFRLSTLIRDMELTTKQTGVLGSLRDFFYLPFILVGQWLSRKYSQVNIVARFMDAAIELPLKTVLRLLRQWMSFLRERHEELY